MLIDDMQNGGTCAPVTDYWSYANRLVNVNGTYDVSGNEVRNGDFSNGSSNWTATGIGWAVIDSAADLFSSQGQGPSRLTQSLVFDIGKTYRVTFDANVVTGFCYFTDEFNGTDLLVDHTGSYDFIFTPTNHRARFITYGTVTADLTIDNVTAVEIEYNIAQRLMTRIVLVQNVSRAVWIH